DVGSSVGAAVRSCLPAAALASAAADIVVVAMFIGIAATELKKFTCFHLPGTAAPCVKLGCLSGTRPERARRPRCRLYPLRTAPAPPARAASRAARLRRAPGFRPTPGPPRRRTPRLRPAPRRAGPASPAAPADAAR